MERLASQRAVLRVQAARQGKVGEMAKAMKVGRTNGEISAAGAVLFGGMCLLLAGCGSGVVSAGPVTPYGVTLHGTAHGGLQPIGFSKILMYAVGNTGYGSAATPLLRNPVTTDATGNFTITADYTCPSASSMVYLVVTGGNPGLAPGTNNAALTLVDLLGPCGNLSASTFVSLNEVTTVAAVYALRPFMMDYAHIGAPASNAAGLANAVTTAFSLAGIDGHVPGPAPAMATVPVAEVNSLGDAVADCVNSDGNAAPGSACGRLFAATTPPGGNAPTDTTAALLNIARYPSRNVAAIFNGISPIAPFQPTLSRVPADWTIGITYTAPALHTPVDVAVDSQGTVWVVSTPGTASAGRTTLSALTAAGLQGSYPQSGGTAASYAALAIDRFDNLWLSDTQHSGVAEFSNGGSQIGGSEYSGGGITGPGPLAFDPAGNLWVVNNSATVSELNGNGRAVSPLSGYATGGVSGPVAIAIDNGGRVWTADSAGDSVTVLTQQGALAPGSPLTGQGLSSPFGIGLDGAGTGYVANRTGSSITVLPAAGTTHANTLFTGGGLNEPIALTLGGTQDVWAVNSGSSTVSLFGTDGTAFSGDAGYGSASLINPYKLAIDGSGSVWVINLGTAVPGSGVVTQLVGAGGPVVTPTALAVQRGMIGQRP